MKKTKNINIEYDKKTNQSHIWIHKQLKCLYIYHKKLVLYTFKKPYWKVVTVLEKDCLQQQQSMGL